MVFPNTLTDGVPKVPKGCSEGLLALLALPHIGISRTQTSLSHMLV